MSNDLIEHFVAYMELSQADRASCEEIMVDVARIVGGQARRDEGRFTFSGMTGEASGHATLVEASGRYSRDKSVIRVFFDKPASHCEEIAFSD